MVNYNNSLLSCNCCDSLLMQQGETNLTIIVVDNNSKPEEQNILKNYLCDKKNIEGLFLKENIGYFPALAKGQELGYSKSEDYDFVVVGNNDLIYEEDFIDVLSKQVFDKKVMVVSPDIIRMDGIHQNPHFINRISWFRQLMYHIYYSNWHIANFMNWIINLLNLRRHETNKIGYETEQYIYLGFGACFILTKSFIKHVRLLDTRSFLMGEEMLLAIQVENAGGKILYKPSLKVNHMDSASFKKMPSRFAYDCERNSFKLYKDFM